MIKAEIKRTAFLLLVGLAISINCFSQDDSTGNIIMKDHTLLPTPPPPEEIFYKGSVQVGGGEIVPIANRALRLSLSGVYDTHLSVNCTLAQHIYAGLELEDVQLGNAYVNAAYNTSMTMYDVGLKIGYYSYMQNDFLFAYSLSIGPSLINFANLDTLAHKGKLSQQTFFVRPDMFIGYRVNDELRVGVDISVLISGYQFNAETLGIGPILPYDDNYNKAKDNNGLTTCVGLGFGLYWAVDEAKK